MKKHSTQPYSLGKKGIINTLFAFTGDRERVKGIFQAITKNNRASSYQQDFNTIYQAIYQSSEIRLAVMQCMIVLHCSLNHKTTYQNFIDLQACALIEHFNSHTRFRYEFTPDLMRILHKKVVIILNDTVHYNYYTKSNKLLLIQSFITSIVDYFFNEFLLFNNPLLFLGSEEEVDVLSGKSSRELIPQINDFWIKTIRWIQWNFFDTQTHSELFFFKHLFEKTPEHHLIPLLKEHIICIQLMLMCLSLHKFDTKLNREKIIRIRRYEQSIINDIPLIYKDKIILALFLAIALCKYCTSWNQLLSIVPPLILYTVFYLYLRKTKISNSQIIINKCRQLESILDGTTKRKSIEELGRTIDIKVDSGELNLVTEKIHCKSTQSKILEANKNSQLQTSYTNTSKSMILAKKDRKKHQTNDSTNKKIPAKTIQNQHKSPSDTLEWRSISGKHYIYSATLYDQHNDTGESTYRAYPLFKDGIVRAYIAASDPDNCPQELDTILKKGRFQRSSSGVKHMTNKNRYEIKCDTRTAGGNDRRYLSVEEIPCENMFNKSILILFNTKPSSHKDVKHCDTYNTNSPR